MSSLNQSTWQLGEETHTMEQARTMVELAFTRLNFSKRVKIGNWQSNKSSISPWEYCSIHLNDYHEIRVGISSGGVVNIDGRSHSPSELKLNVWLEPVEETLKAAIQQHVKWLTEKPCEIFFDQDSLPVLSQLLDRHIACTQSGDRLCAYAMVTDELWNLIDSLPDFELKLIQTSEASNSPPLRRCEPSIAHPSYSI